MKIWLKMLIAIILGIIFGIFIPDFTVSSNNTLYQFLANLALNALLYLTGLYVLVKSFIGFINLKRNNLTGKIFLIFIICVVISVFFSIIITIGFMNLDIFQPEHTFSQKGDKILHTNMIDTLLLKIINDNIFSVFVGPINFILPIIFIALIFGLAAFYTEKKGEYFVETIESFNEILNKIVRQILEFFPLGAIFIIATFLKLDCFSYDNISFLVKPLIAILLSSLAIITFYTIFLFIVIKKNTMKFFLEFLGAGLVALTTGNSAATIIPLTEHLKNNMGVKKDIADTLGPLGMIINKSGSALVATVVLMSLILIYTPNILKFNLQLIFIFLIFAFSFCLDGSNEKGFLVIVTLILNFPALHLEQDSYLLFLTSVPILSRIGIFIDTFSTAAFIIITSKFTNNLENRQYLDFI